VRAPEIGCVSFVGGRDTGADVAHTVAGLGKRHILEQEGLNTWGVWDFSGRERLAAVIPKLFDYGKQRCTAYPRFVVQRSLFDAFLAAYLPAVRSVRVGHPLAVTDPADPLPELDFGPLINAAKAKELTDQVAEASTGRRTAVPRPARRHAFPAGPARTARPTSTRSPSSTRHRPPRCTTRNP
jgi:acyl-CoA reductase-like NAD-dependent aldehyde dehydrogenase